MIEELKQWILTSKPGQRAIVPCASHQIAVTTMQQVLDALDGECLQVKRCLLDLLHHGGIDFVVVGREKNLYGREWVKGFPPIGRIGVIGPRYWEVLASRIRT